MTRQHLAACSIVRCARGVVALVAAAGGLAVCGEVGAGTPMIFEQIVNQPAGVGMVEPTISLDGRRVAFRTTANLTGQNADRSVEVYVYDRDTRTMKQVTSTPGGSGSAITYPMITPDGKKVCFVSAWAFVPGSGNGTFQIWEVDVDSGGYRLVTNNPASTPVFDARMSGDGRYFVFLSRINPTGENPNGSLEVFRVDRVTGATIQVSDNANTNATFLPDINGDGSVIVWAGRENYDGTNPDASQEIWRWKDNGGTVTRTRVTATPTATASDNPKVDGSGRFVTFTSLIDFTGGSIIGRKYYVFDAENNTTRLITNPGIGGTGFDVPDSEISYDGKKVYFETNRDLVSGQNADLNRELYSYDVETQTLSQLTSTTGGVSIVNFSDDATRRYVEVAGNGNIVYRSDRLLDPTVVNDGANIDLFIGACAFATVTPAETTASAGDAVTLSAAVRLSGPSTYRWLKDGVEVSDGAGGASIGGGTVSGSGGEIASDQTVSLTISGAAASDAGAYTVRIVGACGEEIGSRAVVTVNASSGCNPADIACDDGTPLAAAPGCTNSAAGPNEGDYNAFFAAEGFFFQAGLGLAAVGGTCDIACDNGEALSASPGCVNNGVNEGDYNCFFNNLFAGCL
ncbi:MAG: PD40 domain-containing protein [Phycisphaerales bacterium]|nr:PD40 domain-containing protein [Phycisphaerales bacterium]